MPRPALRIRVFGGARSARIFLHDRDVNDKIPVLGNNLKLDTIHSDLVRSTEQKEINRQLQMEYQNRIKHIYEFLEKNYPSYFVVGVQPLSEVDLGDIDKFYHNNKYDLIYDGLNVKFIKAFFGKIKTKENGNLCSFVHIRKYKDAILWGAKVAKCALPSSFYLETERFLNSFKKEAKKAAKDGMMEESEADPISWSLYKLILEWAIEEGNVYVWVFTILQWNCMARSINIGELAYHNFWMGEDSIKIRYDRTKSDQTGEKVNDKNIYGNPFNPLVCPFLALGVWFCLEANRLSQTTNLFGSENAGDLAPCNKYTSQLSALLKKL